MYSLQQQLATKAETIPRAHAKDPVLHLCLDRHRQNLQRWVLLIQTLVALQYVMEPSVSEVADGACCERDEGMNSVHSLLNNIKMSMTNHKNRSVGILFQGSPRKTPARILENIRIQNIQKALPSRLRSLPRGRKILDSEGQRSIPGLKRLKCLSTKNPASQQEVWHVLTAPMWSITSIARSTDRSWSDCLRDRIVVGALAGESWPHRIDESGETANLYTELEIY